MASNVVRAFPAAMPPQPSQQDWMWDGANWVWCGCPPSPCPPMPSPPPCPPSGFPTPCPPWFPPPAAQAPWYPGANGGVSFSATPPVNPVRGHFWWDGTTLHLFDGAAWVDVGGGGSGAKGVVDGSVAAPGQIGELITYTFSQPFAVSPSNQTFSVSGMVVPPGDWDIWAWGACNVYVQTVEFYSTTVPTGMSSELEAYDSAVILGGTGTVQVSARVVSPTVRGTFSVATPIPITLLVQQTVGSAGTFTLNMSARRVR